MSPFLPTKRKLQHQDHQSPHLHLIKMSKPNFNATSQLQFFVRMMSQGKTLVLHANSQDTVKSLHHKIEIITGIPFFEQRLIYCGKQLHWDQTLAQSSLQNDAGLQLVGRMRSTPHPQACQVIDEMVSFIFRLCKGTENCSLTIKLIKSRWTKFLNITTRNDNEEATGYLQIFMSSCVPSALVMLFLSQNKGNKDCAGECIRQFVTSSVILLPKTMYAQCAPIVLEFCKLLGRAARDDSLYSLCRSSFGSMVKYVGVGRGSKEGVIGVEEILPFVGEIASSLSRDLVASMDLTMDAGPLVDDVHDFSVFLFPLRTAIKEQVGFEGPVSMNLCEGGYNVSCYGEEIEFLYGIFIDLLDKMEQCLQRMEECLTMKEKGDNGCLALKERADGGWCQCLAVLKELHSISELYDGADELFWSKLRCRKVSVSYLIVKYAKRSDDHQWILEHKDITNFESRRHLAMMILPELKHEYEEFHEMLIDRSQLLAESFEYVAHADPDTLRSGLFLEFKNEEATGPGVLREWFFLVCQAIFNHQNALFVTCPNDRRRFFPNPASKVDPLHLEYFSFSGRVIALALMHKVQVGILFDRVFFLQLAGMSVALEDVRDADPYLYHSCKQILEMDAETVDKDALGLTFVREVEELGTRRVVDLCPDGSGISVNSKNRREYVDLLIEHRFVTSIAEQVANFAQGFADIITSTRLQKSFFQSLDLEDLDWMLHGSESDISVEDWRAHTVYKGYKESDPQIFWFWKIVGEMSLEQRKVLLFFWTSVKYLPIEGFCGLASRVYICRSTEPYDRLPSSHTCFYQLCFPPYPSLYVMQDRFGLVTQEHVGCSFGIW